MSSCLPLRVRLSYSTNPIRYIFARPRPTPTPRPTTLSDNPRHKVISFGLVTDVQYAHLPTQRTVTTLKIANKHSTSHRTIRRRRAYRSSIERLADACRSFDKADVDFVVSLGDLIEGYDDTPSALASSKNDISEVLRVLSALRRPVLHIIGNHCRRLPDLTLRRLLRLPDGMFYTRVPAPGWRLIALHTAEGCPMAVDATQDDRNNMREIALRECRPQHDFHGCISTRQLQWLSHQLDTAVEQNQKVIILSHYPLADGSARASHVIANTSEVRRILERDGTPVVACLAGHDHLGGFLQVPATCRRRSVAYITFPAMLEAAANHNEFAFVTLFSDGSVQITDGFDSSVIFAVDGQEGVKVQE